MKKLFLTGSVILFMLSCNTKTNIGKFTISGEVKNVPDQKIFLEELHFSQQPPQVIDTGEVVNGKVNLKSIASEEGLYRLRLEKGSGYIFINDQDAITFSLDGNDAGFKTQTFNSPANGSLKKFISVIDSLQAQLFAASNGIKALTEAHASDSALQASENGLSQLKNSYNNFVEKYIDTTASPVIALFALGYTQQIPQDSVSLIANRLTKKFPNHHALNDLVAQYNASLTQPQRSDSGSKLTAGLEAPDLTMPDVNGKPLSLKSLRGKYVLVDFWASWCGPCREENPNVVAAYQKFKDKNFTILGVSLDKNKAAWLKAIKDDNLTWNHMSDLKFWNSAAVPLYNIDGIPFNVLLDPQGRIIAAALRGDDLQKKLQEVLK